MHWIYLTETLLISLKNVLPSDKGENKNNCTTSIGKYHQYQ